MSFQLTVTGGAAIAKTLSKIARNFDGPASEEIAFAGADIIREKAQSNIVARGLVKEGDLFRSVETVIVNRVTAAVRVGAVYGAVHEFGLPNQPITDRQRRFFWAMWAATGEDMWKALALSATYTIPAKPYLRPAMDEGKRLALVAMAIEAWRQLRRAI